MVTQKLETTALFAEDDQEPRSYLWGLFHAAEPLRATLAEVQRRLDRGINEFRLSRYGEGGHYHAAQSTLAACNLALLHETNPTFEADIKTSVHFYILGHYHENAAEITNEFLKRSLTDQAKIADPKQQVEIIDQARIVMLTLLGEETERPMTIEDVTSAEILLNAAASYAARNPNWLHKPQPFPPTPKSDIFLD